MRSNYIPLTMSSTTMTGTNVLTSNPILVDQIYGYAVQVAYTGTPTGTFKLQASCDKVPASYQVSNGGPYTVTNWTDITGATVSASGAAGNGIINVNGGFYNFFRLVYTNASGTGTITVSQATIKGV